MESRIKIKYEVEENNAAVQKELPFSVGIMGDFCGNASPYNQIPVNNRDFIEVTADNLTTIMQQLNPTIRFAIDNRISNDKALNVCLSFHSMDDFKANAIIQRVPELKKLYELRTQLKELQIQSEHDDDLLQKLTTALLQY
ncbi:MAG: type VI secretion system contractile sheath small subunit, partial [Coxiella sp. (in: Bacteria)]